MVPGIDNRFTAEHALKESEASFRTLFNANPDAALVVRVSDRRIVNINENCSRLFGFSREDLVGEIFPEIGLWTDSSACNDFFVKVGKEGEIDNLEISARTKSDRIKTVLASARLLGLRNEQCLIIVMRDITVMKEAELRLVRSEERFRALVAVMGEGVVIIGFNGEVVQCNLAAERILGVKSGQLVGMPHDMLFEGAISEDGAAFSIGQMPTTLTLKFGKEVDNEVIGLPRTDGGTVWLQVNSHSLGLDRDGKPVATVVSFADVTRLKRIESELRDSQRHMQRLSMQFQGVLEAITDRILVLNNDMQVIWTNWRGVDTGQHEQPKVETVCCYEMTGIPCGPNGGLKIPLCDNCPVKKAFATSLTEGSQAELPDGRTLSLRAFPVLDKEGNVVNVIEVAQDITESLHHQAQAMRTGQLAALGELAAGVAHEINNPINGVINYAQLILNKAGKGSREEELGQRIIREGERIATIVRELLYFAREESQELAEVSVAGALAEALALTQNQLDKEGVQLQVHLPDDLPKIISRSHQIQQVFLNLISNSRHALAEKYPETDPDKVLRITGEETRINGEPAVRISFRDHGAGIEDKLLPRVMNPFVTTKPSREGTGLGLSLSHEIVQKHGGTLSISSELGIFTEVVIVIPAVPDPAACNNGSVPDKRKL